MIQAALSIPVPPDSFSSQEAFWNYCSSVTNLPYDKGLNNEVPEFARLRGELRTTKDNPLIFETSWGGVYVTKYEHPNVEKFLVVDAGKYLAFENHEQKTETLTVKEGLGVLIYRPESSSALSMMRLRPGESITLQPGQEHCLVAISNLLVFEESIDPKGMDKDLIFIYMPKED
jgi:hypothetical protein